MLTNPPVPDDDSHLDPDRFLVGAQDDAARVEALIESGQEENVDHLSGDGIGAVRPPTPQSETPVEDDPGLIEYRMEQLSHAELLRDLHEARLKAWLVKCTMLLVVALSLTAVICSDSPTTTALGLVANLLAFAIGVLYGRNHPSSR